MALRSSDLVLWVGKDLPEGQLFELKICEYLLQPGILFLETAHFDN